VTDVATPTNSFDLFICHASEDKELVARPLAEECVRRGLRVWLDELQMTIGDSLNGRIEAGLAQSRFGVVVISPAFFAKAWTRRELAGLSAREVDGGAKVILPVWHEVDRHYIAQRAPVLADRLGALTSAGLEDVADKILLAIRQAGEVPGTSIPSSGSKTQPAQSARHSMSRLSKTRQAGIGLVLVLAGALGFLVAPTSSDSRAPTLPNIVANQSYELSLPAGWRRGSIPSGLSGLKLDTALTVRGTSGAVLVVGGTQTNSPTLLPGDLLSGFPQAPRGEARRLGSLQLYRYRTLSLQEGPANAETVYAVPTTADVVLGVCVLPPAAIRATEALCEEILSSLELLSGKPLSLGPQPAYASALDEALTRLMSTRKFGEVRLSDARTPLAQQTAAMRLADAYARAASTLRTASSGPGERAISAAISATAEDVAQGYEVMAAGAHRGDGGMFARGGRSIVSQVRRMRSEISSLAEFGYRISS
jgi:hypothetical protein